MSEHPTTSATTAPKLHDVGGLPGWFGALQKHVFMSIFVLASGFIIAQFLILGLAPQGAASQLSKLTLGAIVFMAGVGLLCGGMTVACSIGIRYFSALGQRGAAFFCFVLTCLFGFVEFYAGLVDRQNNVPFNHVDATILSWFGWQQGPITPTLVIVAALPALIGIAWGFAQYEAPEVSLEEAATAHARKLQQIQFAAEEHAARAAGVRQVAGAARGRPEPVYAPTPASDTSAESPAPTAWRDLAYRDESATGPHGTIDATWATPPALAAVHGPGSRPLPGSREYPEYLAQVWRGLVAAQAGSGQQVTLSDLAIATSDSPQQVRDGILALRLAESEAVPAGRQPRRSKHAGLYELAS